MTREGLGRGPAASLIGRDPAGELWLAVPPRVFELGPKLAKQDLEDLQIKSAVGAYPCRHQAEISVGRIEDLDEADRRVYFRGVARDIELTAFTNPSTRAALHQLANVGSLLRDELADAVSALSVALASRILYLEEDPSVSASKYGSKAAAAEIARLILANRAMDPSLDDDIRSHGLWVRTRFGDANEPALHLRTTQSSTSLTAVRERVRQIVLEKDYKSREFVVIVFNAPVQDAIPIPIDEASYALVQHNGFGEPIPTKHVRGVWAHAYGTKYLRRVPVRKTS